MTTFLEIFQCNASTDFINRIIRDIVVVTVIKEIPICCLYLILHLLEQGDKGTNNKINYTM